MPVRRELHRLVVLLIVARGLFTGTEALAGQARPSGAVDSFYGSYQEDVPIEVPAFHGIEPKLSLHYDSSAPNGFVGVGWNLTGFSVIERAIPGKGAPKYDGNDIYLLDGHELVPCAAGSASPSCTTGGTHSTKTESYTRIAYNGAANTWTITQKDGTISTLSPGYQIGTGVMFRWGLTSVRDTRGNTVNYGWWCDPGADCYPDSITYNGVTVTLFRDGRPDPTTFANGIHVGRTN